MFFCADAGLPFLILVPHLPGHKPISTTKFKEASLLTSHWSSEFVHINGKVYEFVGNVLKKPQQLSAGLSWFFDGVVHAQFSITKAETQNDNKEELDTVLLRPKISKATPLRGQDDKDQRDELAV